MAARSMSPRSMVAVVVEENTMAIVTRAAVVPVVMVEGSIVAKQIFLSWPSAECPFLGNSKKGVSVFVRREIQSMLSWIKYDYVSRGSGRLRRREGLNSPS